MQRLLFTQFCSLFVVLRFCLCGSRRAHTHSHSHSHNCYFFVNYRKINQSPNRMIEWDWSVSSFAIIINTQAQSARHSHAEWINSVAWLCNNNNNSWCEQLCNNYNSKKFTVNIISISYQRQRQQQQQRCFFFAFLSQYLCE